MAKKYVINKGVPVNNGFKRDIEADSYQFKEGYFHFYSGLGQNAEKVFSVAAGSVHIIEVEPQA